MSVRAASHGGAPALAKIFLVFVFLGVHTVGFSGKTLKHEAWVAGAWQLHPSFRRRGASLLMGPSLGCPRGYCPL